MFKIKEFNLLDDLLAKAPQIKKDGQTFFLIGFRGKLEEIATPRENWVADNNTMAEALIFQNGSVDWKFVKFNKKGYFIETKKGRIFLNEFK